VQFRLSADKIVTLPSIEMFIGTTLWLTVVQI
jgi:hypothetical protein